jgi:hypothetical protein
MYIKSYSMSRKIYLKTLLFMGLCLWITAGLKAQEPGPGPISPEGEIEDPLAPVRLAPGRQAFGPAKSQASDDWSFEVGADYGYVASASLKQGLGTVTEQSAEVGVIASRKITDGLVGIVGADWQTFSFGYSGSNIPLPQNLQGLNAIFGVDVQLDEASEWLMRIQLEPGVFGTLQSIGWHQVNMPGVAAFTNVIDDDFQWFIAIRVDAFQFFPVIPVPGFRWRFAENWLLNGSAPKPTIDWRPTEGVRLFVGGDILNLNARLPDSNPEVLGDRSLAGALVNYFEARLGGGIAYEVTPGLSLQAEGGAMVWRTFDFPRLNNNVNSTMAPYFQIALRGQF